MSSNNDELSTVLLAAERSFSDFDAPGFADQMDQAAFMVPCLSEPITPEIAAHYHRLQGLRQFGAAEEEHASAAFAAARSADPVYRFPLELIPLGHTLHELYERAPAQGPTTAMPTPKSGALLTDGVHATTRPDDRPTVLQHQDPQGAILSTTYLMPSDALPAYATMEPPTLASRPGTLGLGTAQPARRVPWIQSRRQLALLGGGLGVGALAGLSYGVGAWNASVYKQPQPTWSEADLAAHERTTNTYVLTAGGLGVAALGLIGSSFLVVTW